MRKFIAACAVLAAFGVHAAPATTDLPYTTGPNSQIVGWYIPVFVAHPGDGILFANADTGLHDFVARDVFGSDGNFWCGVDPITGLRHYPIGACPIFWSPLIGIGKTTEVFGLDALAPGQMYTFICTIHHAMVGTLIALPA